MDADTAESDELETVRAAYRDNADVILPPSLPFLTQLVMTSSIKSIFSRNEFDSRMSRKREVLMPQLGAGQSGFPARAERKTDTSSEIPLRVSNPEGCILPREER